MTACWALRGAIDGGRHPQGISHDKDFFYVATGSGIDRWTFPGFVQTTTWFSKAGGISYLCVDNGGQIFYKANTGGHLWRVQADGTGDTDLGAITAGDLVYSPHDDCIYGVSAGNLYKITLAGTETAVFTGGTSLFRPTIQRGGIIWVSDNFSTLRRFDPDAAYAQTTFATSGTYPVPACPGKAGVYFDTHFYSEGITQAAITCSSWISGLFPTWSSDYNLILGCDSGSGVSQVWSLRCGAKPPLRIRQRSDELVAGRGSPRLRINRSQTIQGNPLRIMGRNTHA